MKKIRTWLQLYDRLGKQPLFKTRDLETARIVAKTAIDNITRVADNYCAKTKDEGNKEIEDFMNNVVYKIMKKRVVKEMLNV